MIYESWQECARYSKDAKQAPTDSAILKVESAGTVKYVAVEELEDFDGSPLDLAPIIARKIEDGTGIACWREATKEDSAVELLARAEEYVRWRLETLSGIVQ